MNGPRQCTIREVADYRSQATPLAPAAAHRFFDKAGRLHFVVHEPAAQLVTQTFESDVDPMAVDPEVDPMAVDPEVDPMTEDDAGTEMAGPADAAP